MITNTNKVNSDQQPDYSDNLVDTGVRMCRDDENKSLTVSVDESTFTIPFSFLESVVTGLILQGWAGRVLPPDYLDQLLISLPAGGKDLFRP